MDGQCNHSFSWFRKYASHFSWILHITLRVLAVTIMRKSNYKAQTATKTIDQGPGFKDVVYSSSLHLPNYRIIVNCIAVRKRSNMTDDQKQTFSYSYMKRKTKHESFMTMIMVMNNQSSHRHHSPDSKTMGWDWLHHSLHLSPRMGSRKVKQVRKDDVLVRARREPQSRMSQDGQEVQHRYFCP